MDVRRLVRPRVMLKMARNRLYDLRVGIDIRRTADIGPLPGFIVVGTMKAGTTSLAGNLRRHPEVFMPRGEAKFFNDNWYKGIAHYREMFAEGAGKLCGEKTPDYMRVARFMGRIKRVVPEAKIIVLLRDPVARLMSEINHKIYSQRLPVTEKIDANYLREVILADPIRKKRTFDRGFYVRQIQENILPLFPAERVFIRATDEQPRVFDHGELRPSAKREGALTGEDRSEATRQLFDEICSFLGVAQVPMETSLVVSGVRVYKAPVTRDAKELAYELYADENKRLFEFLGYEIPSWSYEVAVGA